MKKIKEKNRNLVTIIIDIFFGFIGFVFIFVFGIQCHMEKAVTLVHPHTGRFFAIESPLILVTIILICLVVSTVFFMDAIIKIEEDKRKYYF